MTQNHSQFIGCGAQETGFPHVNVNLRFRYEKEGQKILNSVSIDDRRNCIRPDKNLGGPSHTQ